MTRFGSVMGTVALLLAALTGCSGDDGEEKPAKSWQCEIDEADLRCTCTFEEPINYANPVEECSAPVGSSARCCKAGAGVTTIPMCSCSLDDYEAGCPAGWQERASCSGLPSE